MKKQYLSYKTSHIFLINYRKTIKNVILSVAKMQRPASGSMQRQWWIYFSFRRKNAIKDMKEPGGSSLPAIKKYIAALYKIDAEKLAPYTCQIRAF